MVVRIATTAKGWTDTLTCHKWFEETFIPQATARRDDHNDPIVLMLDGHESHKSDEILGLAAKHNISLYFLPPHTTHRLQPLDVGLFGPLQRRWQERCDEVINDTGNEISKSEFIREYMGVRDEVFTGELIRSAWKTSGIWPPNPNRFTEEDFAPSQVLSYVARFPHGFPELPENPDLLSHAAEDGVDRGGGEEEDEADGDVEMDDGNGERVTEDSNEMDGDMGDTGDVDEEVGGDIPTEDQAAIDRREDGSVDVEAEIETCASASPDVQGNVEDGHGW